MLAGAKQIYPEHAEMMFAIAFLNLRIAQEINQNPVAGKFNRFLESVGVEEGFGLLLELEFFSVFMWGASLDFFEGARNIFSITQTNVCGNFTNGFIGLQQELREFFSPEVVDVFVNGKSCYHLKSFFQ